MSSASRRDGGAAMPVAVPAGAPVDAAGAPVVLELERASVHRRGSLVWADVSLQVRAGEFVAVLGPNGAGKSTLLEVCLGLLGLSAGSARVLGQSPGAGNPRIGYLPQRRQIDATTRLRGVDLVRLGWDGARWGLPLPGRLGGAAERRARARVEEVIDLVGARPYSHHPIGELSGGEQQRLMIAQALVRRPQLLMLDEPLDSLDLSNQGAIAGLVQGICHSEGVAVLLVAHDVNPILGYLDRIVYFAGATAVQGPPGQVITAETLSRLYQAPIEVITTPAGRVVVVGVPEPPHVHGDRHG